MNSSFFDHIAVLHHSAIRIDGTSVIYFDPFQLKDEPHDADMIFITHDHYDHFSPEDIRKVATTNTHLIMPESTKTLALEAGFDEAHIHTVAPGTSDALCGITFETVPAYNVGKHFHPKENGWVGYIVTMNGLRYYVAGDTDLNDDITGIRCDVALVPVGGTYTMTATEAADLVNTLKTAAAVPTHYGSVVGSAEDARIFKNSLNDAIACKILM